MQCFVHPNLAAAAVCKKCGKAMCVDCSAFANHSGLCPNCRKDSIAEGLRKIKGIKRVNIWVSLILSVFLLAGTGVTYFLILQNPLVFLACIFVPAVFLRLVFKLRSLRLSVQGLNANLAQINFTLGKAIPQAGVINPLNIYQDLSACKAPPREESWNQLTFIEEEEIPNYKAGITLPEPTEENAEQEPAEEKKPAEDPSAPPESIEELQNEASKLVAHDDIYEGQITFKEVLEQILEELNQPVKEPKPRPRPPKTIRPKPQKPVPKQVRPPLKENPDRLREIYEQEEKRVKKERIAMRRELAKLREQIDELYKKNI